MARSLRIQESLFICTQSGIISVETPCVVEASNAINLRFGSWLDVQPGLFLQRAGSKEGIRSSAKYLTPDSQQANANLVIGDLTRLEVRRFHWRFALTFTWCY